MYLSLTYFGQKHIYVSEERKHCNFQPLQPISQNGITCEYSQEEAMETEGRDKKYFSFLAGILLLGLMIGHSVPESPSGRLCTKKKKGQFCKQNIFFKVLLFCWAYDI